MHKLQFRDAAGAQRPPRIALVIERFDARRGGAESYTSDLAVWLAAAGADVHVLARRVAAARGERLVHEPANGHSHRMAA